MKSRRYRELIATAAATASPRTKAKPNMSVIVMQQPSVATMQATAATTAVVTSSEMSSNGVVHNSRRNPVLPFGASAADGSEEWLLPLLAKEFIEDHDLEWRDLDYSSDVGPPPTSFWIFICQYDCRVFPERMTERYYAIVVIC